MGRIYFNPKTGEFWEASRRRRKPPEGFEPTRYVKDHRFKPHGYLAMSFYCPECKHYHYYVNLYKFKPRHAVELKRLVEKHGCTKAKTIVELARAMGGMRIHYDTAERIVERGERAVELLKTALPLKGWWRRRVVKMLAEGELDEAEVQILASRLT